MNGLEALRIFLGTVFVLFVPGLAWSYVFFARKKIDWIERVALSFGLSIALVPIAVFWLSWLFQMKVNLLSISATVVGLTVLAMVYLFTRRSTRARNAASRFISAFGRYNRK
jgi:uncharacterized membrane protein